MHFLGKRLINVINKSEMLHMRKQTNRLDL